MKLEFKNHLTLRTVPKTMTIPEINCSILTWLLVFGFVYIMFSVFSKSSTEGAFTTSMTIWVVALAAAVINSFIIDFKQKIINPASIMWLAFLIYMLSILAKKL
ncbi:MAG: hypothetical protein ACK5IJ_10160 [Mangrovibacterium sp.]